MPLGRSPRIYRIEARGQRRVDNELFVQMAENLGLCAGKSLTISRMSEFLRFCCSPNCSAISPRPNIPDVDDWSALPCVNQVFMTTLILRKSHRLIKRVVSPNLVLTGLFSPHISDCDQLWRHWRSRRHEIDSCRGFADLRIGINRQSKSEIDAKCLLKWSRRSTERPNCPCKAFQLTVFGAERLCKR